MGSQNPCLQTHLLRSLYLHILCNQSLFLYLLWWHQNVILRLGRWLSHQNACFTSIKAWVKSPEPAYLKTSVHVIPALGRKGQTDPLGLAGLPAYPTWWVQVQWELWNKEGRWCLRNIGKFSLTYPLCTYTCMCKCTQMHTYAVPNPSTPFT